MVKLISNFKIINRLLLISLFIFCLDCIALIKHSNAGTIDIMAVEDKGETTTIIGHNEFLSYMRIELHAPDWGDRAGVYERGNREVFVIDQVITEHFWNIYPSVIHIPQPIDLDTEIMIPFFMATGSDENSLAPLPDGSYIDEAQMQDGYNNWHDAYIEPFFDIWIELELPEIGPNGENYTWDLSGFDPDPYGDLFLAKVTMTVDQFSTPIPEPATMFLVGLGLFGLAGFRKKLWK